MKASLNHVGYNRQHRLFELPPPPQQMTVFIPATACFQEFLFPAYICILNRLMYECMLGNLFNNLVNDHRTNFSVYRRGLFMSGLVVTLLVAVGVQRCVAM